MAPHSARKGPYLAAFMRSARRAVGQVDHRNVHAFLGQIDDFLVLFVGVEIDDAGGVAVFVLNFRRAPVDQTPEGLAR